MKGLSEMTTQDLREEVEDLRTYKDNVENRLDKIGFLLFEILEEYGSNESIDPKRALDYLHGTDNSESAKRDATICYEYQRILTKIAIACDYADIKSPQNDC